MRSLVIYFSLLYVLSPLNAQEVQEQSASAPTNFQSTPDTEEGEPLRQVSGGVFDRSSPLKLQTFSLRGGRANEVGVQLEGIRLNSPARGEFDFGLLSWFGLPDPHIVRGGYSPLSSNPRGHVLLRLPSEERVRSEVGVGSYGYLRFAQQVPHGSFSFEHTENDFLYREDETSWRRRENNKVSRINVRAWKQEQDYQFWGQFLYSQQQLPGSTEFEGGGFSRLRSFFPLLAFQYRIEGWNFSHWAGLQARRQEPGPSHYHLDAGTKLEKTLKLHSQFSLDQQFKFSYDRVFDAPFDSASRGSLSYSSRGYWSLTEQDLIHPRIRFEYLSDLDQAFAVQPGIGGRHQWHDAVALLWNVNFLSRPPTFNDLYFELEGENHQNLANPELDREQSVEGDFGYEFQFTPYGLRLSQAAFARRTMHKLQSKTETEDGIETSQVQNVGTEVAWGFENDLSWAPNPYFSTELAYTWTWAEIDGKRQIYQPRHSLYWSPKLHSNRGTQLAVPLYYRSSVKTDFDNDEHLDSQWDLGIALQSQIESWQFQLQVFNLLGWERIERKGYPLPQETWARLQVSKDF